jgi:hypothetical protein
MAFAEYTGEFTPVETTQPVVLTDSKITSKPVGQEVDNFAKEEKNRLAKEKVTEEAKSFGLPEWMVVPLASAAAGAVGTLAAKKLFGKNETPSAPKRIDPTLAPAPAAPTVPQVAPQATRTLEESAALANSLKPVAPVAPTGPIGAVPPTMPTFGPTTPTEGWADTPAVTPVDKANEMLGKDGIKRSVPPQTNWEKFGQFGANSPPGSYSSPAAPMAPVAPPTTAELALQHAEKAVAPTLTPEITNQAAAPAAPTDQKPKLTRVVGEAKIARDAEIARIANNPVEIADQPGMRQNYKKPVVPSINPETGKAWMGSSGYNYLASQIGHEKAPEAWKALYGEKNVPFKTVEADYAAARKLEGVPPKTKGGAFGTPENIPSFIKGKASPGFLGALAGLGLLGLAGTQKSKESMAKAGEAIQNIGIAPEALLRGKGDELGQLGGAYVNAGNYQYKAQLEDQLKTTKDANRRAELMSELNKIKAPFRK